MGRELAYLSKRLITATFRHFVEANGCVGGILA